MFTNSQGTSCSFSVQRLKHIALLDTANYKHIPPEPPFYPAYSFPRVLTSRGGWLRPSSWPGTVLKPSPLCLCGLQHSSHYPAETVALHRPDCVLACLLAFWLSIPLLFPSIILKILILHLQYRKHSKSKYYISPRILVFSVGWIWIFYDFQERMPPGL